MYCAACAAREGELEEVGICKRAGDGVGTSAIADVLVVVVEGVARVAESDACCCCCCC